MTASPEVAQTIMEQVLYTFSEELSLDEAVKYGDKKLNFFQIANASQYVYDENSIMFRVQTPKLDGKVIIKLNGMDLYDIEFWIVGVYDKEPYIYSKQVKEINDIYCDQLGQILKEELGL